MKKRFMFTISIILCSVITILTGCSQGIAYGKKYTEYIYIGEQGVFVSSGRYLTLKDNDTFVMEIEEQELTLRGAFEHLPDEKSVYLDCDDNSTQVVKERFKEKVLSDSDNAISIEMLDMMLESITINEEIRYHKNYLFSTRFISAHRYIDTTLYSYGEDYNSFEGVYSLKNYDGLMLLRQGNIYVQDIENPVDGEFPENRGTYIYANGFITMSIINDDGIAQSPQRYLVADLIIPEEIIIGDDTMGIDDDLETEEWYSSIEDQLDDLAGAKIKVLVLCFYTTENL